LIFKHLSDKDVFENFYKSLLSKRLLGGKDINEELERSVVAKLKAECGYQFTSKIEGMFKDLQISTGLMEEYRRSTAFSASPVQIDVSMLTTGYWPLMPLAACRLPAAAQQCVEAYGAFYASKHSGRKLAWATHIGAADVKVR
jgi:cullin 3